MWVGFLCKYCFVKKIGFQLQFNAVRMGESLKNTIYMCHRVMQSTFFLQWKPEGEKSEEPKTEEEEKPVVKTDVDEKLVSLHIKGNY